MPDLNQKLTDADRVNALEQGAIALQTTIQTLVGQINTSDQTNQSLRRLIDAITEQLAQMTGQLTLLRQDVDNIKASQAIAQSFLESDPRWSKFTTMGQAIGLATGASVPDGLIVGDAPKG